MTRLISLVRRFSSIPAAIALVVLSRCLALSLAGLVFCLSGVISTPAVSHDLDVIAFVPLQRALPSYLDKANGIGLRFQFGFAPPGITPPCAKSIKANVNELNVVDHVGGLTSEEFRAKADTALLAPSEAAHVPAHHSYTLSGEDHISGAMCTNLPAGANAGGFCTGTISGSGYTVVYHFDPVACRYDNVGVGAVLDRHLSVSGHDREISEADCTTKLREFVSDIDSVLAANPRNILDVFGVLDRHFPLHGCAVKPVSGIIKQSRYFRSIGMNGPKMHVFALNSETSDRRGVAVIFGLTENGDSSLPFAMWSPPFP